MLTLKKVIIFSHTYPPALDGGSQILFQIAKLLRLKRRDVRILTSDALSTDDFICAKAAKLKTGWDEQDGMPILRLPTLRRLRRSFKLGEKLVMFKTIKDWLALFQTGPVFFYLPFFWLRNWKPDLIIAGVFPTTIPIYARFLSFITDAKLVLLPCFHIDDEGFYKKPLVDCLKRADKLVALTDSEKNFYKKKFEIDSKKIIVFRPSVAKELLMKVSDKARFSKPPTILFLGNQAAHKRIELLIDAFKMILKKIPQAKLIIAGKRTLYSPKIDKKLENLSVRLRKKVTVIDGFDKEKERKLLDKSWVVVNPSIHESLGLVFLEAWARKKPVIGADLPVTRELISEGVDGFLFARDKREDLLEKINKIIFDKDRARKMGENGYKKLKTLKMKFGNWDN